MCEVLVGIFPSYFSMSIFPRFFWEVHRWWPTRGACRSCSTLEAEGCGWPRLGPKEDETFDGLLYKSCMSWEQLISLDISDEYLSILNDLCNLHDTRRLAINWLTGVQATIEPQSHLPPQAEMPRLNCASAAKRPFSGGCSRGVLRSWQCWAWTLMVEAPPKSKVRRDEFEQHMKPEAMSPRRKSSTKHWLCVRSILVYPPYFCHNMKHKFHPYCVVPVVHTIELD